MANENTKINIVEESIDSDRDREDLILNLLSDRIRSQGKDIVINPSDLGLVDVFAPDGFDEFVGETVVEIKGTYFDSRIIAARLVSLKNSILKKGVKNVVFIFQCSINKINGKIASRDLTLKMNGISVHILDNAYISKLLKENKRDVLSLRRSVFEDKVKNTINFRPSNWKVERDEILTDLISSYNSGQFSLFLGAGVSASAGMPDWETLINSLFVNVISEAVHWPLTPQSAHLESLVTRLNELNDPSTLMSARYIRKGLTGEVGDYEKFRKSVTASLYSTKNKKSPTSSPLISEICALCMPQRTGAKVHSIVTYNFDDLIERELTERSTRHRSIYNEIGRFDQNELPVFHVHGFLPEDESSHPALERSTLVFSEEGYHQIYADSYHWSNLVQLNSLRESRCLMIGLSLTDPNLRRLLDISSKYADKPRHFAFMKRLSETAFCNDKNEAGDISNVVTEDDISRTFLESHHKLSEQVLSELGVRVIWYEDYSEIPDFLKLLPS